MKILIRHMMKKTRSGGYAQRDEVIDATVLRFGRGAECEVHLTDPRVLLHHIELTQRPAGLYLEAGSGVAFQLNGVLNTAATLKPGDKIYMGPYDLVVLDTPDGMDGALSVEYARPLGDDLQGLVNRSNITQNRTGLSIRGWAWLMLLLTLAIGLGAPLFSFYATDRTVGTADFQKQEMSGGQSLLARADQIWQPGPMSSVHAHFGDQCGTCHTSAFQAVSTETCVACHKNAGAHADPVAFPVASIDKQACASCHKEHTGDADLVLSSEQFCINCHSEIQTIAPDSHLKNVAGFSDHPEFQPTIENAQMSVTADRVSLGDTPGPVDLSNLKFTHKKHLNPAGMKSPDGSKTVLTCATCHQTETGGVAMLPAKFETSCATCHSLQFEPNALDRRMPHSTVAAAKQFIEDTYSSLALRGGFAANDDTVPASVRRIIGSPLTEQERLEGLAWAETKAKEVIGGPYGKGACGTCHEIEPGETATDWTIAPVHVQTRWLPKGEFTHLAHQDRSCTTCHAAPESTLASDVLLPSIAVCQTCHGGEFAQGKVRTACTSCHGFHNEAFGHQAQKETLGFLPQ
jgi:predicted CXXCH cytochrome family protein